MKHPFNFLFACTALAMAMASKADVDVSAVPVASQPVLNDSYPERRLPFPGNVVGLADVVYSTLPGYRPLRLDLYLPGDRSGPLPLVIYVHGGGWISGHTRQAGSFENWPGVLASIAARGYAVTSLEYRLSGEARFPAAIQDVKAAIRWLRSQDNYHIDPHRAVIWGGSAGGQLAALAAVSCGAADLEPAAPAGASSAATTLASDCVQGLVAWYGVFDLRSLARQSSNTSPLKNSDANSPPSRYLGCALLTCDPKRIGAASAATYVDAADPPVLLIHGVNDQTVPIQQSRDFLAVLISKRVAAELIEIPNVDHSFVGADLAATQAASRRALAASIEFFDRTIGPQATPSAKPTGQ